MNGRSVLEKPGLRPSEAPACVDLPPAFAAALPASDEQNSETNLVLVRDRAGVAASFAPGKRLGLGYSKRSGAHASDLSRDMGWEMLAAADFLPVTQVALDDDWSALRFRPRAEIRRLTRASERA
ncbi:hypothetical protein [uncultured Sphingomonas sp.]|uniref:hypothetical protein n=1 Tax=uncultured Sphingomonas sp. TaxID=158754 RepID=UPI0025D933D1|nr:hypothetical protein [uncultured Sphingomonas sp.]